MPGSLFELFHNTDGYLSRLPEDARSDFEDAISRSPAPEETRRRVMGQAFVAQRYQLPDTIVVREWPIWRRHAAKQLFGRDEDLNDFDFAAEAGNLLQREKSRDDSIVSFASGAMEAALDPEADPLVAYAARLESFRQTPDFDDEYLDGYRRAYSAAFDEARIKLEPWRDEARAAFDMLREFKGLDESEPTPGGRSPGAVRFEKEGALERLFESTTPDDRNLVYMMLSRHAQEQGVDPKSFFQKLGETLERDNVARPMRSRYNYRREMTAHSALERARSDEPIYVRATPGPQEKDLSTPERLLLHSWTRGSLGRLDLASGAYREVTKEERAQLESFAKSQLARIAASRELAAIADESVDPAKGDSIFERMVLGAAGSVGHIAVAAIPGGIPLVAGAHQAQVYDQLRMSQPDMALEDAQMIATVSAVPMALIDRFEGKMLFGKTPGLRRLFGEFPDWSAKSIIGRGAARFGAQFVMENAAEALQDFTPAVVQGVASALDEDIPGVDWAQEFEDFKNTRADVALAIVPLVMIGAGVGTYRDAKTARAVQDLMADPLMLRAAGIDEGDIPAILFTEPDKRLAVFQEAWSRRGEPDQEALDKIGERFDRVRQVQEAPDSPTVRRTSAGRFNVAIPGGPDIETGSIEDARAVLADHQERTGSLDRVQIESEGLAGSLAALTDAGISEAQARALLSGRTDAESVAAGTIERGMDEATRAMAISERADAISRIVADQSGALIENDPASRSQVLAAPEPADPVLGEPTAPENLRVQMAVRGQVPPPGGKGVSAPQVIRAIADSIAAAGSDAPLRVGRIRNRRYLGVFEVRPEVARIRTANDIPTAAHEAAHAIEKAVYGWKGSGPWRSPMIRPDMKAELLQLGHDLYGKIKPAGGYAREGWAEFLRLWITDPAKAEEKAPKFSGWFGIKFLNDHPKLAESLRKAQEMAVQWKEQGAFVRARESIVETGTLPERMKSALSQAGRLLTKEALIESAEPLRLLAEQARKKAGRELSPLEDPYFTFSARRLTHDAIAEYWTETAMTDTAGNHVGPSLKEALAPVKDRRTEFTAYLWARRALALWDDPNRPKGRNPGISRADAAEIVAALESPEFALAAGKVYEWNGGVLNYAAQASPSFARIAATIRKVDPGYYIPLKREFEEAESWWKAYAGKRKGKQGGAKGGSFVDELRGSGRRIREPFAEMISQASATILKAHERLLLDQIIRLARVEGMGNLVVEVPRDMVPAATRSLADVIDDVRRKIEAQGGSLKVEGKDLDLVGESLSFFMPSDFPKGRDPVVPIWEGGKVKWYEVDRGLYATLNGLEIYRLPKVFDLTIGTMTRVFRAGTTGLRASFSLVTNPLRDLRTLHLNSRAQAGSARLFFEWMRQLGASAIHAATSGKVSNPHIELFRSLGGQLAQPLGQDIGHTRRAVRRLFQGRVVRTLDPRNVFDFVRELLQFPESAARIAELKLLTEEIGWKPGTPITPAQAQHLLLSAKQVTTDFSAAGNLARVLNQIVPFLNSGIQGPRAHLRALERDPGRFMWRGLQLTILALANWWRNKDEDHWLEMDARARYLATYIPFEFNGRKELLIIPRAFEADGIFLALAEALADAWYQEDPETAGEWFRTFFETTTPSMEPAGVGVAVELLANRDFFFDRPIVPAGEQRLFPEEQYSQFTSRVAIRLGEMTGTSPRKIDHAIRGIFGGLGGDLSELLGRGTLPEHARREKELSDFPVFGRLFQEGGASAPHPVSIERLYDRLDYAEKVQRSNRYEETEDERETRLMLGDAARALSILRDLRRLEWETDERRRLSALEVEIAREANRLFDEATPQRREFQRFLRTTERGAGVGSLRKVRRDE